MSVYTVVDDDMMRRWLQRYRLGPFVRLQGIAAGVTNTNYFLETEGARHVLTLFEALRLDELPYYLGLMDHLSAHGVACPAPLADRDGGFASLLAGKPACLVSCLSGRDTMSPDAAQCHALGHMLARMHAAGQHYPARMANPRGRDWMAVTARALAPECDAADARLLQEEVQALAALPVDRLPEGVIHADLFRDNVLMDGARIAGFIDFYYACNDTLLYDIAIAINDWARQPDDALDDGLARALLAGYQSLRPLTGEERAAWPAMLRAAALRFWLSRLQDQRHPMPGALTYTKDPGVFRRLILAHRDRRDFWL